MSNGFAKVKEVRHEQLLKYLEKKPGSASEMSEALGHNYHTVRKDLLELATRNLVYRTGRIANDGGIEYAAGSANPIPLLRNRYNNAEVHPADLVGAYVEQQQMASAEGLKQFPLILSEILFAAHNLSQGSSLDVKRMSDLRLALHQSIALAQSTLSLMEQVYNNDKFWQPEGMAGFVEDPKMPDFATLSRWAQFFNGEA